MHFRRMSVGDHLQVIIMLLFINVYITAYVVPDKRPLPLVKL